MVTSMCRRPELDYSSNKTTRKHTFDSTPCQSLSIYTFINILQNYFRLLQILILNVDEKKFVLRTGLVM